jgi:hypothetical protein
VVVEKKTAGRVTLPAKETHRAGLCVHAVALEFSPRVRDESVTA